MKITSSKKESAVEIVKIEEKYKLSEMNLKQLQNIFLNAPAALSIFEGPKLIYILANKAYEKISNRKAVDLLGKSMHDVFPELKGTGTLELFHKTLETGESFSAPEYAIMLDLKNEGVLRQCYFNFSMEPLKNDSGKIYAVMAMSYDITEQVEARKKNEENEKQQAFLLKLSDALRLLSNPVDIEEVVTKNIRDFTDADWCLYAIVKENHLIIERDAVRDVLNSVAGNYYIDDFPLFKAILAAGRPLIVDDVHTTEYLDEELKKLCITLQNISFINVPIVKNGKSVGLLSLVQGKPRKWTDSEVQLIIETAERTWAVLESAKVEEALRKSEEKYRILFTSIDQGYALCEVVRNKEGKGIDYYFLEVNHNYEKHSGISVDMVLGKTIRQVFPTIDKLHIDTYVDVVDNQCPAVLEHYFENTDRWFAINTYPGEKDRFAILFSDITERKKIENKIKASQLEIRKIKEQLELSIAAGKIGVWHWDVNKDILTWSREQHEIYGFNNSETITSLAQYNALVVSEDLKRIQDDQSAGNKLEHEYDFRIIRKNDGAIRWIKSRARNIIDPKGALQYILGVNIDITEQKLLEEKLLEAKEFAENAAKSRQQFLSNMSHEIRTPLNSILGFTNVLLKTELGVEQKEFVQAIKTSGKSLTLLINDILDLAKVDSGKMTFEKQPFEINKSITSILHSFDLKIKEKNLELIKEYDTQIPSMLCGDSLKLNQIILNLISNAVKFTHEGKIKLSVKLISETDENVTLEFTVTDTGIGIADNKLNSIFNIFEQAEISTSTSYGGTGLGLAIVKQLVEGQGGSVSVKSKLGEGSIFSFILPFGKTNLKIEEEIVLLKPVSEIKNLRVLVAEDVALNQILIKIILSDFGFEYEIVGNGKLAIREMQSHTYDIILMDLQMPEMNGFEATEFIRKTLKSHIPIIALTADVTTMDVTRCKEFGMDDYISKPINENLLYSKIVELVKRNNNY